MANLLYDFTYRSASNDVLVATNDNSFNIAISPATQMVLMNNVLTIPISNTASLKLSYYDFNSINGSTIQTLGLTTLLQIENYLSINCFKGTTSGGGSGTSATEATQLLIKTKTDNLDVLLSTLLEPTDTLTGVTTVGTITNPLPVGTNRLGTVGLNDGTNNATIKASSLVATSIDTSIVTQESVNSVQGKNWLFTGVAGISTINSNLISATLNSANALDLTATNLGGNGVNQLVRSANIQLVFTASPTAGVIRVVGSNDNLTFTPINFYDSALTNPSALQTLTVTGSATNRYLIANTAFKYLKLEITTAIVGATAKTIVSFSPIAYATPTSSVITDGTTNGTFKPASTAPVAIDTALVTSLSPNGNTIKIGETIFINSAGNTSVTQLGAGATFAGTIVSLLTGKSLIVSANSSQPYTVNITQYNDLAGTQNLGVTTFTRLATVPFNEAIQMNGDYAKVSVTNTGGSATTGFFVNTYFGDMPPFPISVTNSGNFKTALLEAIPVGTNRIGTVGLNDGANSATINASNGISTSTDTSIIVQESINSTQGKNWLFTGTAGISTINSNLISAILNGATAIDLTSVNLGGNGVNQSVRSAYIQLVFTASPTAGAIRVVGSNDNLTFTSINFYDGALTNPSALQTLTVTGSATNRYLIANTSFKFLKLEITTAIVGATAQTITTFSPIAYATPTSSVITDGTTNGTFKPASTASVVGDTALVVTMSPNSATTNTSDASNGSVVPGVAGTKSSLMGVVYNTTAPTATNGQQVALQGDVNGKLQTVSNTGSTIYVQSTTANTSTQLASLATFTSGIESVLSYPQIVLSIRSDQPFTLTIEQFSDLAGTIKYPDIVYTRIANQGFNQPITLSGSYYRLKILNTGASTTTTLFAETWFGTITATPNLTDAGSLPVDVKTQCDYIVGQATQTAVINNILPSTASTNALDAGGYNSATTTIVSTGTGGTFLFEGSNDNVTFEPLTVKRTTLTNGDILTTAITATASTFTYEYAVKYKYIRLRIVTAITGGSIRAYSRLSSNVFTTDVQRVANNQSTNFFVSAVQSGTWIDNFGYNATIADVASSAITTTATTATITPTYGLSYQVNIPVTAVSGTTPIMSVRIEESNDTGTNWYSVYTFPNITTTGVFVSPKFNAKGNRVRYVQTISGTTPSFTRAINRMQSNEIVQIQGSVPVITNTTITTGGTSQVGAVAKPNRNYLEIQNTSTGDLWINFNTNAGINIGFKVTTGQSWSPSGGTCPESSVTIFGATTGQTFAIAEF